VDSMGNIVQVKIKGSICIWKKEVRLLQVLLYLLSSL